MTRRTRRLIFELGLMALLFGGSLMTAQDKPEPTFAEVVKMPVVYSVPGMDRAAVRTALVYRTVEGRGLEMDVYLPPDLNPGERRPAILFVHGGPVGAGMKPKGMGVFKSYGALAAASGFVGVTFDHRYYGPGSLMDADQDVAALEAHVRAQAADLHVDEERLALWAFSGGGPFLSRALRERPAHVRAVVAYYPVLDLRALPPGPRRSRRSRRGRGFPPRRSSARASDPSRPCSSHGRAATTRGSSQRWRLSCARACRGERPSSS